MATHLVAHSGHVVGAAGIETEEFHGSVLSLPPYLATTGLFGVVLVTNAEILQE